MLAPFHSTIDSGEHEKYLFLSLYGNTENSLVAVCALEDRSVSVKRRKGDYALFSVLSNILQKVLSKRIAC